MQFFVSKKKKQNTSRTAVYVDVRSWFRHLLPLLPTLSLLLLLLLLPMLLLLVHYCWLVLLGVFVLPTLMRNLHDGCCTELSDTFLVRILIT